MLFWALATALSVAGVLFLGYVIYGDPGREGFSNTQKALLSETEALTVSVRHKLEGWAESGAANATSLRKLSGLAPLRGNSFKLLPRGETAFEPIFAAIDSAQSYVLVQFYIFRDDQLGMQMQERLLAAAARGARVYLLFDRLESSVSQDYLRPLAEAGIEVVGFAPERRWNRVHWRGFRNHRKMVLVDGHAVILGGINVGDEYVDRIEKRAPWIDTQLELQGPAVLAAQLIFVRDYYCATRHQLDLSWEPTEASGATCSVSMLATDPDPRLGSCTLMFATAMATAKERIWLATPYFIPDEKGITAIELAVLRGVEVRVLLPGSSDIYPTEHLAWHFIDRLLPLGVRFFHQKEGSMHQKVVLIDSNLALIGSANFDQRSFKLNLELTAWIQGEAEASAVQQMLVNDFAACQEVRPQDLVKRSWTARLLTNLTRILSPVL